MVAVETGTWVTTGLGSCVVAVETEPLLVKITAVVGGCVATVKTGTWVGEIMSMDDTA